MMPRKKSRFPLLKPHFPLYEPQWPAGTVGYQDELEFMKVVLQFKEVGYGRMEQMIDAKWDEEWPGGALMKLTDHLLSTAKIAVARLEKENVELKKRFDRLASELTSARDTFAKWMDILDACNEITMETRLCTAEGTPVKNYKHRLHLIYFLSDVADNTSVEYELAMRLLLDVKPSKITPLPGTRDFKGGR